MPDTDVERAYRDGQVDARLAAHDQHFARINGSIESGNTILATVERKVTELGGQITGLLAAMPELHKLASDASKAQAVTEALRQKRLDDATFWDRYRVKIAWGLGALVALTTTANFWLRLLGIGGH